MRPECECDRCRGTVVAGIKASSPNTWVGGSWNDPSPREKLLEEAFRLACEMRDKMWEAHEWTQPCLELLASDAESFDACRKKLESK